MPQIRKSKKLPWTPSQMFDLVADVEKYPQFLPWCANGKLVSRNEHELVGSITAQKGAFHKSFTTRNRFAYPHWMDIALVEGPFRHLRGRWEFVATDDGGCEVRYSMDFEVPLLLAPILGGLMSHMSNTMVDAFARRAEQVYGA